MVGFICKNKKNRFRSSWLKTTCIRKAAKYVASAYPWVKLPNPWFPFFTYLRPNNEGEEKDWSRTSPENKCPQN